jgi:dienelactone hydrolase
VFLTIQFIIELIKIKQSPKGYTQKKLIIRTIGYILILILMVFPSIVFPQNKPLKTTGKYEVDTKTYTYEDTNRLEIYSKANSNRQLNIQFWYPKNLNDKLPIILFSHGAYGVKSSNESLYNELASHGYVVCSIDHTYQCFITTDEKGNTILMDKGYMKEVKNENSLLNIEQSFEYYKKWMKIRTDDINFVLNHIIMQTTDTYSAIPYNLIDINKIGVMGHSLGGSAALGVGRMRNDIKAVIALESPFMCDIKGVNGNKFIFSDDIYPIPMLNIYSDSSWSILELRPQYAENAALLNTVNKNAYNMYLEGVGHLGLTDFSLTSPILANIMDGQKLTVNNKYYIKKINKTCLDFFNYFLRGIGNFSIHN